MNEQEIKEQALKAQETAETTAKALPSSASSGFNLGGGNTSSATPDSRDAEIERLKSELQRERVEHGRVKALSQSDSEKTRRIADLEREVEELKSANQDYLGMLPEEMRDNVDPDQLKVFGTIAKKMQSETKEEFRRRDAEREEEKARTTALTIERQIENEFPGFLRDTAKGGNKCVPWERFLGDGQGSAVLSAYHGGNFKVLSTFIKMFLAEIGSLSRNDANGAVASPRTTSSAGYGGTVTDETRYSYEQYSSQLEKAGEDVRKGDITGDQYRAVITKLNKARDEGRVDGRR